jgi:sulfate adenylyltransferase
MVAKACVRPMLRRQRGSNDRASRGRAIEGWEETMALIEPHGGTLQVLYLPDDQAAALRRKAGAYPCWDLSQRQLCDLKLLLSGGFSPLQGFLGEPDYEAVLARMRLADGTLWPIPVMLDVSEKFAGGLRQGDPIGLRDAEGFLIAVMTVEDIFEPDRRREA